MAACRCCPNPLVGIAASPPTSDAVCVTREVAGVMDHFDTALGDPCVAAIQTSSLWEIAKISVSQRSGPANPSFYYTTIFVPSCKGHEGTGFGRMFVSVL